MTNTDANQTNEAGPDATTTQAAGDTARPWLKHYPQGLAWDVAYESPSLPVILDRSVEKFAAKTCTNFLGAKMSYGQLGDLTNRAAKGLQKLGVKKGTKVGLILPNTPTYIIYYFAVLKAGGTVVNCNPLYSVEELDFQVKDSTAEIMVTLDLKLTFDKVEKLLESGALKHAVVCSFAELLPGLKSFLFKIVKRGDLSKMNGSAQRSKMTAHDELIDNDGRYDPVEIDTMNDLAVLQYTGGTTGTPKGAMLTHKNVSVNIEQVHSWATDLSDGEEKIMGILPFFHVFAMTSVMNFGVSSGAEIILIPKFELDEGLKIINREKPTVMPGVPTLYNAMSNHPKIKDFDLSSLKFCISGGAALPIEVKRKFEELSGARVVEGYGLSETSPLATCNPVEGPVRDGSIGIPVPHTEISIRSIEDPEKEMPLGENGEICIKGPQVMKGYWNNPEETKNSFVDGFFRTGDVGHMSADDGFIYIVDRIKDMIIASGFKIYPRRIEEAIYELDEVEEVTVVGIEDEYRGEAPKAFIKLREGRTLSSEQVMEFLKPKISKIELPAEIEFRDELPKTMIGKLSKKELRAEEEERTAPDGPA